tara:strand:- start:871 stop:1884 length:1014 start_codon:yes stop_codon:yes gene_type:complete
MAEEKQPSSRNTQEGIDKVKQATQTVEGGGAPIGSLPPNSVILHGYQKEHLPKGQGKKIAILGTCPSRELAPVNDLTWEIWTIGPGGKNANRWERLFEMHGAGSWPEGFRHYLHELKDVQPPRIIYTEAAMPDWPANQVLNKEGLFGKYGRMWFQSQISYALAVAIEEGATCIGIWGIDLEAGEEYRSQFAGAKYFMDIASLAGIDVVVPEGCGLLRDPTPYPDAWETHLAMTLKAKKDHLEGLRNVKVSQLEQIKADIAGLSGEIGMVDFLTSLYVISAVDPNQPKPHTDRTLSEVVNNIEMLLRGIKDADGHLLRTDPELAKALEALPAQHDGSV